MGKVVVKNECRWGGILGIVGNDFVHSLAIIEGVLEEVLEEMKKYDERLDSRGVNPADDAVHRRYLKISCDLGAILSVLSGGNIMLSGIVCDLLEDSIKDKNCN